MNKIFFFSAMMTCASMGHAMSSNDVALEEEQKRQDSSEDIQDQGHLQIQEQMQREKPQEQKPKPQEQKQEHRLHDIMKLRSEELQKTIDDDFYKHCSKYTTDSHYYWHHSYGQDDYYMVNLSTQTLVQKIISDHTQSEINIIDVGAGNGLWGKSTIEYIVTLLEEGGQDISPLLKTINVYSLTGERVKNDTISGKVLAGHVEVNHFFIGECNVQNISTINFAKGKDLKGQIDLVVSNLCFLHLNDPVGTMLQFYDMLRPQGIMALQSFFSVRRSNTDGQYYREGLFRIIGIFEMLKTDYILSNSTAAPGTGGGLDFIIRKKENFDVCKNIKYSKMLDVNFSRHGMKSKKVSLVFKNQHWKELYEHMVSQVEHYKKFSSPSKVLGNNRDFYKDLLRIEEKNGQFYSGYMGHWHQALNPETYQPIYPQQKEILHDLNQFQAFLKISPNIHQMYEYNHYLTHIFRGQSEIDYKRHELMIAHAQDIREETATLQKSKDDESILKEIFEATRSDAKNIKNFFKFVQSFSQDQKEYVAHLSGILEPHIQQDGDVYYFFDIGVRSQGYKTLAYILETYVAHKTLHPMFDFDNTAHKEYLKYFVKENLKRIQNSNAKDILTYKESIVKIIDIYHQFTPHILDTPEMKTLFHTTKETYYQNNQDTDNSFQDTIHFIEELEKKLVPSAPLNVK